MRQVIQKQIRLESLGEELRVLYVALTRAKEKLILTGTVKKIEDYQAVQAEARDWQEEKLPFTAGGRRALLLGLDFSGTCRRKRRVSGADP